MPNQFSEQWQRNVKWDPLNARGTLLISLSGSRSGPLKSTLLEWRICITTTTTRHKENVPQPLVLAKQPGMFSLSDESNSLAHCWDVLKVSTVFLSGLWVLPPPVQCSNTGLKKRNKKCDILMQPINAPNCCSRHSDLTGLKTTIIRLARSHFRGT